MAKKIVSSQVQASQDRIAERLELIHTHLMQRAEDIRYRLDNASRNGDAMKAAMEIHHSLLQMTHHLDLTGLVQDLLKAQEIKTTDKICSTRG